MKARTVFTASVILLISTPVIYVFAQGGGGYAVGVLPPVREIVLLQAIAKEEGKQEGVQIISPPASRTTLINGTLKIEMLNGSVQEIPLLKVKKLRIETWTFE